MSKSRPSSSEPDPVDDRALDAFFEITGGRDGLATGIHPDDEMLEHIRNVRSDPRTVRFEYFRSGFEAFQSVERIVACAAVPGPQKVLDFACGCGRITRFFARAFGPDRVWASDIDPTASDFVATHIGARVFYSCADPEDLELDHDFDLIFVGSLFSHLPRPAFERWLAKLHAALSPGGLLLFSTHGRRSETAESFEFITQSETDRLPTAEYGTSFVTPQVVQEIAAAVGVGRVEVLPREIWNSQDIYVAAKDLRVDLGQVPRKVYGGFERIEMPAPNRLWVTGVLHSALSQAPPRDVRLFVDGQETTGVEFREAQPSRFPGWRTSDWYVEGDASRLSPGEHSILAVAETAGGDRMVCDARIFSMDSAWEGW